MADIYNHLIRRDMDSMSTDELRDLRNASSDTLDGLMAALKVMGECAFWACDSENYSDSQAKEDLHRISESLMYLPRIAEALAFNADEAQFKIYQREGFPYTEVDNGKH
ncbi:TPA: hypothetical protein OTQ86_000981 [Morganella morganii]|uniref:Uncharacterized protein n=1 Tax=Salmonella enterica subsp. enterica serovar Chester TaxID=149386 RepID=A0A5U8SUD3_SALET|nr:hypothetical protein [Morganella morganii]EBR9859245.1 hypothetical protein [Salmonella enterica subsp. enterica serovar Chester]MBT0411979.1 hypothetical protein [Morganella morganii subsp. morganii]MBV0430666.1 hypothetical protein [Morganella morganii subsp. morganii]RAX24875.1 hypothetical protein DQ401_18820 [Morganella morganii]HCT2374324.1 hypothetical protein [Morganella morganii]